MKQQLWIVNSSLLLLLLVAAAVNLLLKQTAPSLKLKRIIGSEEEIEEKEKKLNFEEIYTNDLFDTFFAKPKEEEKTVSPIPEPKEVKITPPEEPKKPDFLPPLNINLKGIAFSPEEMNRVSMIADETQKELVYHIGDKVKDAQIIKISRNRITLLRTNGQHEILFLRKDDNKLRDEKTNIWTSLIKKTDANSYDIDFSEFIKQISLETFAQDLFPLSVYKKNKPVGIKISSMNIDGIGPALGLQKGDLIKSVNNIDISDKKNRIKAYDNLTQLKKGDEITLNVERNKSPITIKYNLSKLDKEKMGPTFGDKKEDTDKKDSDDTTKLKKSKFQEREERIRKFAQRHPSKQQGVVEELRQRLIENMKEGSKRVRVRR